MKLAIKNMVCNRCIMVVNDIFEKHGIKPQQTTLGEVTLDTPLSPQDLKAIDHDLEAVGFQRIDDKKTQLIERLKNFIIQKIHHSEYLDLKFNWSSVLSEELHYDYNYLSSLFSSEEGITLEHYIIHQKIERAKELLCYDELNMNEISDRLGYSSVQHLSTQFKKVTGLTPSTFKKSIATENARKTLDSI